MTRDTHPALDDIVNDLADSLQDDDEGDGVTIVEYVRDDTITRWVQYEAPVFVKVTVDETGQCEIGRVILACDPATLDLARDHRGHFRVYDENFHQPPDSDEALDGVRGAVSLAEDRDRWPEQRLVSLEDGWETGPDPRQVGAEFYDEGDKPGEHDEHSDDR